MSATFADGLEHRSNGRPRNRLLAALPDADLAQLAPRLEPVNLELKQILFDVDAVIPHAYFLEDGVVSVLGVMKDGTAVETATIGHEGLVGLPLFLGTDRTAAQGFCQVPGRALRLEADAFRQAIAQIPALRDVTARYTQALFTLVAQSSACNRLHSVEQRCARWLLMTHDRVGRDEFPLTHLFLSQMLGVRRATVTEAAGALQGAGLIEYAYGRIAVRDRPGLERAACECYAIIRREFDRLLHGQDTPSVFRDVTTSEHGKTGLGEGAPRVEAEKTDRVE